VFRFIIAIDRVQPGFRFAVRVLGNDFAIDDLLIFAKPPDINFFESTKISPLPNLSAFASLMLLNPCAYRDDVRV